MEEEKIKSSNFTCTYQELEDTLYHMYTHGNISIVTYLKEGLYSIPGFGYVNEKFMNEVEDKIRKAIE